MTIQSIAIISENPTTQKQSVIYIESFSSAASDPAAIEHDTAFEEELFGFDIKQCFQDPIDGDDATIGSLCSLKHQFLLHSALELFADASNSSASGSHGAMFVGFICAMEDFRFYGYRTNTKVKIIVSVKDDILPSKPELQKARDDYIESAMVQIHSTYVDYMLNPFSAKQGNIRSKHFRQQMNQIASM